jgi:hypothetical protein
MTFKIAARVLASGLALAAIATPGLTQSQGLPSIQTICRPTAQGVETVQALYSAGPVKHVHVFTPVGGGANKVFTAPPSAKKIYAFTLPAGSWKMMYGTGGIVMSHYNPVIVVEPFSVIGRICDRAAKKGGPAS